MFGVKILGTYVMRCLSPDFVQRTTHFILDQDVQWNAITSLVNSHRHIQDGENVGARP